MSASASSADAASGRVRVKLMRVMQPLKNRTIRLHTTIVHTVDATASVCSAKLELLGGKQTESGQSFTWFSSTAALSITESMPQDEFDTTFTPVQEQSLLTNLHHDGCVTLAYRGGAISAAPLTAVEVAYVVSKGAIPIKVARMKYRADVIPGGHSGRGHSLVISESLDITAYSKDTSFSEVRLNSPLAVTDTFTHTDTTMWITPAATGDALALDHAIWTHSYTTLSEFQSKFTLICHESDTLETAGLVHGATIVFVVYDEHINAMLGGEDPPTDTRSLARKLHVKRRLLEPLVRPGVGFFPDTAHSQSLIPLFDMLGVDGVCTLACCDKVWKSTLDAWRATQATKLDIDGGAYTSPWTAVSMAFVARKYPKLRKLSAESLRIAQLQDAQHCKALRHIEIDQSKFNTVDSAALVSLAATWQQLRIVRIQYGLDGRSLIALAQACPHLEELSCNAPAGDGARFSDEGAKALEGCPALKKLALREGPTFSRAAVMSLVQECQSLVYLELGLLTAEEDGFAPIREVLPPGLTYVSHPEPKGEKINFKVVEMYGNEYFFKARMCTRMIRLFTAYCRTHKGVEYDPDQIRFHFDGERIQGHQTPLELEMEQWATIDVSWAHGVPTPYI